MKPVVDIVTGVDLERWERKENARKGKVQTNRKTRKKR
jgi:hypothetical protein